MTEVTMTDSRIEHYCDDIKVNIYPAALTTTRDVIDIGKPISLHRSAYTYDEIEKVYAHFPPQDKPPRQCPGVETVIPIVGYCKNYSYHTDFLPDLFSGLSVACLHLPQGLAYGLLASLTPISGVYTSILSVSVYIVFGTVPHMSMGTNAVLSLITAATVEREADALLFLQRNTPDSTTQSVNMSEFQLASTASPLPNSLVDEEDPARMDIKLGLSMTTTFICGVILLIMGLFRMGFLTNYMPSSFVGGFTSAAALHIAMSQMKHIFHIKVPIRSGFGRLLMTILDVLRGMKKTNMPDVLVWFVSFCGLLFMDRFLSVKIKKKFGHPLPSNLLLVILGTVVSHIFRLHTTYGVAVVGPVGEGLPTPSLPAMGLPIITNLLYDSLIQAVIVFTMSISMAMLMAKIHEYELDSNRELVAYGACNLLSSFFPVQPSSASPPRTMVLSNSGARTTLCGVSTALVLLAGVSFLGKLFEPLPKATLAAMIIVAVLDVVFQCRTARDIWRVSRTDGVVWLATWFATACGDLVYGVCTGVLTAALGFMVNNQYIRGELLVLSVKEDLLVPGSNRAWTRQMKKTRVFYFPSQLFFANTESFKRQLYHHVFDPATHDPRAHTDTNRTDGGSLQVTSNSLIDTIILDCSAITYVDIDGINMLKAVAIRYHNVGVQVLLARVPHTTMEKLERGGFFSLLPRSYVFHDVVDALYRKTDVSHGLGSTKSSVFLNPSLQRVSTAKLSLGRTHSTF